MALGDLQFWGDGLPVANFNTNLSVQSWLEGLPMPSMDGAPAIVSSVAASSLASEIAPSLIAGGIFHPVVATSSAAFLEAAGGELPKWGDLAGNWANATFPWNVSQVFGVVGSVAATANASELAPSLHASTTTSSVVAVCAASEPSPSVLGSVLVTSVSAIANAFEFAPHLSATGIFSVVAANCIATLERPSLHASTMIQCVHAVSVAFELPPASLTAGGVFQIVRATATANEVSPIIGGGLTFTSVAAIAQAASVSPIISGAGRSSVVCATATANGIAPSLTAGVFLGAVPATAIAAMLNPFRQGVYIPSVSRGLRVPATVPLVAPVDIRTLIVPHRHRTSFAK